MDRKFPGMRLTLTIVVCWLVPVLLLWATTSALSAKSARERLDAALADGTAYALSLTATNLDAAAALSRLPSHLGNLESLFLTFDHDDERLYTRSLNSLRNIFSHNNTSETVIMFYKSNVNRTLLYDERVSSSTLENVEAYRNTDHAAIVALSGRSDGYVRFYSNGERLYIVRNLLTHADLTPFATLVVFLDMNDLRDEFNHISLSGTSISVRLSDYLGRDNVYPNGRDAALENPEPKSWNDSDASHAVAVAKTGDYILSAHVSAEYASNYPEMNLARNIGFIIMLGVAPLLIYIVYHTNKYLRGFYDKSYNDEIKLRDTQIGLLQAQINPHFFNNTLELINWQARAHGDEDTGKMVESLGTLIGAAVDRGSNPVVPLYEEMEYVEAFLYITATRYKKRLTINVEIDDAMIGETVPKLSIQPLLENAASHSIALSPPGEAAISLRVRGDGAYMYIEVINTGTIPEKDRAAVDKTLATHQGKLDSFGRRRIGLANVCQRLALLYGGDASLTYKSGGGRTVFTMVIRRSSLTEGAEI